MELGINKNIHNIVWFILFTVSGIAFIFIPTLGNYANNIDKNSYEPLIYKGVGAIFIIIALYRAFRNNSKNEIEETTSNNTNTDIDIITNNNEMSYKEFIDKLEIDEFDEIILMAHTGKNSLSLLRTKLTERTNFTNNIKVKIILKNPYSETSDRLGLIKGHIKTFIDDISSINGISVDVRYYNGLPYFHGLLCKYKDFKDYYSYVSYYKWENHKTKACKSGKLISDNTNELFLTAKSWFEHLFSKEKLHTIIFDLDDTIINSYDSQINSWVHLVEFIFNNKYELGKFKNNLKSEITIQNIRRIIKEIFLKTTKTEERWDYLFNNISNDDIKKLGKIRFKERTKLTISEANLFDNCKYTLEQLSKTYNLVIISSTSEYIIRKILKTHELNSYFSLYLGSNNKIDTFNSVEDKTPYLIKISNLVGVPFNRMLFVGDSQTDYRSSKQLNVKFVSANMIAKKLEMGTFIKEHNGLSFDSYEGNSLITIVEEAKGTLWKKYLYQYS